MKLLDSVYSNRIIFLSSASFVCAAVDCAFGPIEPGCYRRGDLSKCCQDGIDICRKYILSSSNLTNYLCIFIFIYEIYVSIIIHI